MLGVGGSAAGGEGDAFLEQRAGPLVVAEPGGGVGSVAQTAGGLLAAWTAVSGAVELGLAAGLVVPATRRTSARASAAFAAVFPANVKMAYDWRHRPAPARALAYARLPLQIPLILWARGAARDDR